MIRPELTEGETILRREMERARRAVEASSAAFHERCRVELFEPLQRIADEAREAHARLLDELPPSWSGNGEEGVDGGREWEVTRRYARGVREAILEPAARNLEAVRVAATLESLRQSFLEDLHSVARGVPPTGRIPEAPHLYLPTSGDPLLWRVGKWVVRARRAVGDSGRAVVRFARRVARRNVEPPPPRTQTVPLGKLLDRHAGARVPTLVHRHMERLHQDVARPLLSFEGALTRWVQDMPRAEDGIDSPLYHMGQETRRLLETVEVPREEEPDGPVVGGEEAASGSGDEELTGTQGVAEVAGELHGALEALGGSFSVQAGEEELKVELARAWETFEGEVLRSGSFMQRPVGPDPLTAGSRTEPGAAVWEEWHRQVCNRLRLNARLCMLRAEWIEGLDRLVEGVGREGLDSLLSGTRDAMRRLEELGARAESLFAERSEGDAPRLAREVQDLLELAMAGVNQTFLKPFLEEPWPVRVRGVGEGVSEEMSGVITGLPGAFRVHPAPETEIGDVDPYSSVVEIDVREIAEQAMDVLHLETLRSSPETFLAPLERRRREAGEIASILEFNLDAARKELENIDQMEGDPAEIIEDARSLTTGGLGLTAQAVRDLRVSLVPEWESFVRSAHDLMMEAYREIHQRAAVSGSVEEHLLGLRSRLGDWLRIREKEVREGAGRGMLAIRRELRRTGVRLLRLLRMGQAAVGTAPITRDETERTLEVIAGLPDLLAGLPVAYQRLFSFDPVSDPGMLVGRPDHLEWIRRRVESRPSELSGPILLTGPTGVGRTSLLNVLRATVLEGFSPTEIELTKRVRDEAGLSALLAEALQFPGDERLPQTLSRLEAALLEAPVPAKPRVVFVERLEHLFLRVPGGADILERLVCFQAATASRILWISTMGQIAWKQVSRQELRIEGLLTVRSLAPLDRAGMEEVIMGRHRRSGLPARFEEPSDPNPLLRRKLRRGRNDRERQELLQADFFDRLHRAGDSSIPMVIFLWLRAADFEAGDGAVHIRPIEPVRMGFLQHLDLSLHFSLKAFLEHGSLTMEEHSEIFRVSDDESFQVFMALRSQLLLEPLTAVGDAESDVSASAEQRQRYRVSPLLTQTVIQHLQNRNIVH